MTTTVSVHDLASGKTTTLWSVSGWHRSAVSPDGRRIAHASHPDLLQEPPDDDVDMDALFTVELFVRELEVGAEAQVVTQFNPLTDRWVWSDQSDAIWLSRSIAPTEFELVRVGLQEDGETELEPQHELDLSELDAVTVRILAVNEGAARLVLDTLRPESGREILGYDMDAWEVAYRISPSELAELSVSPKNGYIMILDPVADSAILMTTGTGATRPVNFSGWLDTFVGPTRWASDESSVAWEASDPTGWRLFDVGAGTARGIRPPRVPGFEDYEDLAALSPDGAAAIWGPTSAGGETVFVKGQPAPYLFELLDTGGRDVPMVTTWRGVPNTVELAWVR